MILPLPSKATTLVALAAVAVTALLMAGSYYMGRSAGVAATEKRYAEITRTATGKVAEAATETREKVKVYVTKWRTVTKEVPVIVEREVYKNVCLDDDGVKAINEAFKP